MKTAISIPDDLFAAAEETAKRLALSRSELYCRAVRKFLEATRAGEITKKLDTVYSDDDVETIEFVKRASASVLRDQEW